MSALDFDQTHDPRRLLAVVAVAGVHAAMIYGLLQWTVRNEQPWRSAPVQVALISERLAERELAPPPKPQFVTPVVTIEPPALDLPQIADPPPTITVAYRSESALKSPPVSAPKLVSTVEYLRPLKPLYPSISRRLREEGLVVLLVLVDESGHASRIEVRDSSGHRRLDRAAQDAVENALFKPYVEDGIARAAFVLIPVEFTLTQHVAQR